MNQVVKDLVCILIVFGIFALLIYGAVAGDWPSQLGVQPGMGEQNKLLTESQFVDRFSTSDWVSEAVALAGALAWYVLGEWGPRSKTTGEGWLLAWLALLLVVLFGFLAAYFWGPPASENSWVLGIFYALFGVLPFYLATALFSPTNTKFVVPGSQLFRKWW